ncbi:MAG: polysaccharide deacetylase family protein [Bacteroidota bacterium]
MNILTIDIEEWYTYELYPKGGKTYYLPIINSYLDKILDMLDASGTKGTFFCLGVIARTSPDVIKRIYSRGHDIGCHSDIHQFVTDLDYGSFYKDTKLAIDCLEQLIGEKITMYRAPAFSITAENMWALDVLIDNGILYDSSIFPAKRRFGGLPSININEPVKLKTQSGAVIREFPISYYCFLGKRIIFSGGGYFRLFPYWLIKYLSNKKQYNLAYFHIRDMDKEQKIVSNVNQFYSYYGIKQAYKKFEKYVKEYQFMSLSQASKIINWDDTPEIKI